MTAEGQIRKQEWVTGRTVDRDGRLCPEEGTSVNFLPLRLPAGTRLRARVPGMEFRLFGYRRETPPRLIYEYTYDPEANWTSFDRALSETAFSAGERITAAEGFWRIAVRGAGDARTFAELFDAEEPEEAPAPVPAWMAEEVRETARRVKEDCPPGAAVLFLMADTHYTAGCGFSETVRSLRLAAEEIRPEALVHLGDFTDGLLPQDVTRLLAQGILGELSDVAPAFYACLGNHDHNYFRGNPDRMSVRESAMLMLGRDCPWYRADLPEKKLSLFFLDSFDPEKKRRYGFDWREVLWFARELRRVPKDHAVLVFSHVPPEAKIHVWSDTIRNGPAMLRLAEKFHRRSGGALLAWIHGHNHAEQVYGGYAFPIVGIGCSKRESFPEHKPAGSHTEERKAGTRTQELWDVLVADAEGKRLRFVRFGAGRDRCLPEKAAGQAEAPQGGDA